MQSVLIFLLISLGSCIAADKDEIIINNQTVPIPITEENPPDSGNATTIIPPKTSTSPTTVPSPPPNTTTTSSKPPTSSTTTTPKSSSTSTTTPRSVPTTPVPPERKFDGSSFVGGIILALGLAGIGFVAFKFYKSRTELYHTL